MPKRWTDEEIKYLNELVKNYTCIEISKILNRHKDGIWLKCKELNIKPKKAIYPNAWTKEEDYILQQYYAKTNFQQLLILLPNRNKKTITQRANRLGLLRELADFSFAEYLKKYEKFNHKLGICRYCGEPIISYSQHTKRECVLCNNKIKVLSKYKRKYDILLDFDKMYSTYDILQWYKWAVLTPTKNNKYINNIPSELLTDDNIKIIVKYVFEDLLFWKSKNDVLNFTTVIINKYKIGFDSVGYLKHNPYKIISLVYPEYNIKEYEMRFVPDGYWQSYDNFLEAVKYYHNTILDDDLRSQPSISYAKNTIKELYPKIEVARLKYYRNKTWTEILRDINIIYDINFELNIAYDGCKLDSNQELKLYDFIHNNLNIKTLKHTGTQRKYKFVIQNEDKFYVPDFIIESVNNLCFDKPLIIEYYGLYIPYKNGDIFKYYIDKTHRKNEYYKNNSDIYFIDLYPTDLKNNFEGVRNKLTSFFKENLNIAI